SETTMKYDDDATSSAITEPACSFAVCDATTGEILQIHHFAAMEGVTLPPIQQLQEFAGRQAASRHQRDAASIAVVRFETAKIKRRHSYRVSLPDGKLVPIGEAGAKLL